MRVCLGRFQQTFSRDDARTWGNRTLMTAVGGFPPPHSVMPELKLLANGALVLTGGRNGLFVWGCDGTKCVDEGGWQGASITSWHNARCPQFNSNCSAGQPWLFPPLCLVSTTACRRCLSLGCVFTPGTLCVSLRTAQELAK